MTELLFSYGTLQLKKVQIASFGRELIGTKEVLKGFKITQLKITDHDVLVVSGKEYHPVAIRSTNEKDQIVGTLYEISEKELLEADAYEVSDYKRIDVDFESGRKGWVYIKS